MGLFDRSSSKSTNTTNNLTENYTDTYNTAMSGGDSEIGESAVVLQHSSLSSVDNSLAISMADNSMQDSSTRTANSNNVDSSDNSFSSSMTDNSNRSSSSNSTTNSSTSISYTDGGAFSMVSGIMGKVLDSITGSQNKLIDLVGLNQKETLSASDKLVSRTLDAVMVAKGETALTTIEADSKIKLIGGAALAVAGLFAVYKFSRGK